MSHNAWRVSTYLEYYVLSTYTRTSKSYHNASCIKDILTFKVEKNIQIVSCINSFLENSFIEEH